MHGVAKFMEPRGRFTAMPWVSDHVWALPLPYFPVGSKSWEVPSLPLSVAPTCTPTDVAVALAASRTTNEPARIAHGSQHYPSQAEPAWLGGC